MLFIAIRRILALPAAARVARLHDFPVSRVPAQPSPGR